MGKIYPALPIEFPIDIKIKYGSSNFTYHIDKGDNVKCRFCGSEITLNNDTVFRYNHKYDHNEKVRCKICGKVSDIVYYCDNSNRVRIKSWDANYVKTEFDNEECKED